MQLDHKCVDFTPIGDVQIPDTFFQRLKTNNPELDSIFGDGILPGSTITLIAKPGIGKSIFCLTLAEHLTIAGYKVGYTSGEEDIHQIAYNSKRLGIKYVKTGTITDIDQIVEAMQKLDFLVIDSFQCLTSKRDLNSRQKVTLFSNTLVKAAKQHQCTVLIIVQMTSSGELKSGTTLPYAVDVNMRIDKNEEEGVQSRIIEVYKNRFGPTEKYSAIMKSDGYEFNGVFTEPVVEKSKKVPVSESRKQEIIDMIEPPLITVERVMSELGISYATANNLLRELVMERKLVKFGRGGESVWKNANVDKKSFLTSLIASVESKLSHES